MRRVAVCGLAFAVWGVAVAGGQKDAEDPSAINLPPGEGRALVIAQCTECHDLERITPKRKTAEEWKKVLDQMVIEEGAELTDVASLTAYLASALGPSAPPLVDVNAGSRDDLARVPGITPAMADKLIAHREASGPLLTVADAQPILGLDAAGFDKAKIYLRIPQKTKKKAR